MTHEERMQTILDGMEKAFRELHDGIVDAMMVLEKDLPRIRVTEDHVSKGMYLVAAISEYSALILSIKCDLEKQRAHHDH